MPDAARAGGGRLARAVEALPPAYFALVMATGIVSLAAHFLEQEPLAQALFWINALAYVVLGSLTLARLALYPRRLLADLVDHARGPGYFTLVAGTSVLGVQCALLRERMELALALGCLALGLWVLVTYAFFAAVTTKEEKPALDQGLNGAWLLAVVATQSLVVLGCVIAPRFSSPAGVYGLAAALHLAGFMLYLPLVALLLYRWMFFPLTPEQLTPPYWINMGALAISTLAGARLLQSAPGAPLLEALAPFLRGSTFFFWASASWWIPLLVALGFWRHVVRRLPLRYDPSYWGMVFPLGMYTVATVQASRALALPALLPIARAFVWLALAAWAAVFVGMSAALVRAWSRARPEA